MKSAQCVLSELGNDLELSNVKVAQRCNVSRDYVASARAALELQAPLPSSTHGGDLQAPLQPALSAAAMPSDPNLPRAFEPPPLNSLDCWAKASSRDRTQFVDAVSLMELFNAAPADVQEAFLKKLTANDPRIKADRTMLDHYLGQIEQRPPGTMPAIPEFLGRGRRPSAVS